VAVAATGPRLLAADPLNGGFLLVNNHGMLFHSDFSDIREDVAYARWLGSGVIRVFGTNTNGLSHWNGAQVGNRIADIAPMLRAADVQLLVAFVNNHRAVPGETSSSVGWMDNYVQLLLPFYTSNWRSVYLTFVQDLITTVRSRGALDVIFAWELGNELHTPQQPEALKPFITEAVQQVRALDPVTPVLPGTMGANHVEPGNPRSPIARWLYCDAPIDAYTLHAYDWVSRQRPGDMPIDWDLDNITSQPCPNGRSLPVIVEELGTSRGLAGLYTAEDERGRLQQELRQIDFVRAFPRVVGFGVWNGASPRVVDTMFLDTHRGLTSYGAHARGGGSCYDPLPETTPGVRCQYEQALRGLHFVRPDLSTQWTPGPDADASNPLIGLVDPLVDGGGPDALVITGWVLDPAALDSSGVDSVDVFLGAPGENVLPIARARVGLPPRYRPTASDSPQVNSAGFALSILPGMVPTGPTTLTLAAHTPEDGTWLTSLQVVVPNLGPVAPAVPRPTPTLPPVVPTPRPWTPLEIQAPQPGTLVTRTFTLQVLAPSADRVTVFLEPDRDQGGLLVGSATVSQASRATIQVTVRVPSGAQTLYVHAESSTTGQQQSQALPIVGG
jgi:hypothetical protein